MCNYPNKNCICQCHIVTYKIYCKCGVAQVHDSNEGFESPPTPPICENCSDEGCDNCDM